MSDEYVAANEPQTRPPTNRERLRREIEEIRRDLEQQLDTARQQVKQTAEEDRRDMEHKLQQIKETLRDGWENVSEKAAAALLKLLR
jgi:ElaB/YqjD/DUF883 family membrane-anchored ribosome-binding protein